MTKGVSFVAVAAVARFALLAALATRTASTRTIAAFAATSSPAVKHKVTRRFCGFKRGHFERVRVGCRIEPVVTVDFDRTRNDIAGCGHLRVLDIHTLNQVTARPYFQLENLRSGAGASGNCRAATATVSSAVGTFCTDEITDAETGCRLGWIFEGKVLAVCRAAEEDGVTAVDGPGAIAVDIARIGCGAGASAATVAVERP
jgi:hypothetical protein